MSVAACLMKYEYSDMERLSYAVWSLEKSLREGIVQRLGTQRGAAMRCATEVLISLKPDPTEKTIERSPFGRTICIYIYIYIYIYIF